MSAIYDNWERLVAAVLRKQQLWELFHDQSRSPSILSETSDLSSTLDDLAFDFSSPGSFSRPCAAPAKMVLISDFSPAFDVDDVCMASAELLGMGSFGSAFKAAMDNGVTIVVKRLNKSVSIPEPDFKHRMDIVGNVRHENVAALRAYYSSGDERLLLYDYYSKGSVHSLLHGQGGEERSQLDWEARLRTAVGAARGIAAIHAQDGGKLVHGNIKASNIFLNSQQYGCVSDVGLANMIQITPTPTARYYAPEVMKTRDVSQASDVYSFGILLLELLTRKSPAHVPGGPKAVDLVKLVTSAKSKERAAKYANPRFEIEDLLRGSAELLGKGTFGTYYKVGLENGNTIVVKRLKNVIVTFEDFQQHMEVIGKMRHENVAELRAYYYSEDEKLLVYDYYSEQSLSDLLHGKTGTYRTFLDWETRLKIAVGAARGLVHIHGQDSEKLVHGNVKSSNIFVNGQRYGIVSYAGLAKLMSPLSWSVMSSLGYHAPEVTDTRQVSQASDVFSFGIMLLALVTRRRATTDDGKGSTLVKWIRDFVHYEWTADVIDEELRIKHLYAEEEMIRVLQIGMECAVSVPEHRPRMAQVVRMLEEISGIEPADESRLEDRREQPSVASRLEGVLEDLLPTLRP
ncbi:putative inactive receptor kinase [Sesamum alatum]|uniref:non-specific serine/threonine protein kinase n=1 Tax=Sesamum alatum TaxID=300844 RepID=A0AAE1YKD9_9LAMI|nr:putative inactive receptor kinase [Sesamum alatum]